MIFTILILICLFFDLVHRFSLKSNPIIFYLFQDHFNVLHIAAMYSREDVVKLLLNKRGVDPFSTGGVSIFESIFTV